MMNIPTEPQPTPEPKSTLPETEQPTPEPQPQAETMLLFEQQPEPEPPPKPRRKVWIAVIAVTAVLVVVGVVLLLRPSSPPASGDPREYIRRAFSNTLSTLAIEQAKQTPLTDILAILSDSFAQRTQQTFSVRLKNIPLFGDLGLRVETRADPQARQAETGVNLTMSGFPLGGVTIYMKDDLVSFASPLFFDGAYGFHLETLGRDFNASALSSLVGVTLDGDLSIPVWQGETIVVGTPGWFAEANRQLADSIAIEKRGEQETYVNGFPRNCEVYEMTAGAEAARRYIYAVWDGLRNDAILSNGFSAASPGIDPQELMEQAELYLDAIANALTGNLSIFVFIHDNRLVRADLMLPFDINEPDELTVSIQIGGGQNISDALSIDAGSSEGGFILKWNGRHAPSDGRYDTALALYSFSHHDDEPQAMLNLSGWYDANLRENNFAFLLDLAPDLDGGVQLSLNGTLRYDKSLRTLNADFDQAFFSSESMTQAFTASFESKPLADPYFSVGNPVLLFGLSADQLEALFDEIKSNAGALLSFGSLF
ncbi:MAG: hypothetical protein FWG28_04880 [Clostridiales bacterium]|nr:hypothetical protein [Clostridiales bacterium]